MLLSGCFLNQLFHVICRVCDLLFIDSSLDNLRLHVIAAYYVVIYVNFNEPSLGLVFIGFLIRQHYASIPDYISYLIRIGTLGLCGFRVGSRLLLLLLGLGRLSVVGVSVEVIGWRLLRGWLFLGYCRLWLLKAPL